MVVRVGRVTSIDSSGLRNFSSGRLWRWFLPLWFSRVAFSVVFRWMQIPWRFFDIRCTIRGVIWDRSWFWVETYVVPCRSFPVRRVIISAGRFVRCIQSTHAWRISYWAWSLVPDFGARTVQFWGFPGLLRHSFTIRLYHLDKPGIIWNELTTEQYRWRVGTMRVRFEVRTSFVWIIIAHGVMRRQSFVDLIEIKICQYTELHSSV